MPPYCSKRPPIFIGILSFLYLYSEVNNVNNFYFTFYSQLIIRHDIVLLISVTHRNKTRFVLLFLFFPRSIHSQPMLFRNALNCSVRAYSGTALTEPVLCCALLSPYPSLSSDSRVFLHYLASRVHAVENAMMTKLLCHRLTG